MEALEKLYLTQTLRPALLDSEIIYTTHQQVGLYEGATKSEIYANGLLYLTSHRILYLDTKQPTTRSLALNLSDVASFEVYKGFLRSSPKVTLVINRSSIQNVPPSSSTSNQPSSPSSSLPPAAWICPICSFSNDGTVSKCHLCGVVKEKDADIRPQPTAIQPIYIPVSSHVAGDVKEVACPRCSFHNHPTMVRCEMCDSDLPKQGATMSGTVCLKCSYRNGDHMKFCEMCHSELASPLSPAFSSTSFEEQSANPNKTESSDDYDNIGAESTCAENSIKLAFRNGGMTQFVTTLKSTLAAQLWVQKIEEPISPGEMQFNPTYGGISGIVRNVEASRQKTDESLTEAFRDLDGLISKAAEMVKLAESITVKLSKEQTAQGGGSSDQTSAEDVTSFKTFLLDLGVASPVTKDSAGALYHQELAKQLAEFLTSLLSRENGLVSLTDVYCLYNRARGVALISPDDLHKACSLFEQIGVPIRLRRFESGLLCIQSLSRSDETTAQRFLEYIQQKGPLSAIDVAGLEGCSVALCTEQLLMTEARGLICRDDSVEGLRFFENLITLTNG